MVHLKSGKKKHEPTKKWSYQECFNLRRELQQKETLIVPTRTKVLPEVATVAN